LPKCLRQEGAAPHAAGIEEISIAIFCEMRAMMALTVDPEAVNAAAAGEEFRTGVRAYLNARLRES